MYELAKKSREAMKSKARSLAGGKDHKTDSSDWSPASPLNADVKTGMRPVGKTREFKAGGVATAARADRKARKSGGRVEKEIGVAMANKDMKAANEQREGKKHIGGMKRGGRAEGGFAGGTLPNPREALKREGATVSEKPASFSKAQKESYSREEGYNAADRRSGRKEGGKKWIQSAVKKPGALHKQLGVPQGEKIPEKKLESAEKKGGKLGQRARLAETLKGFRKGKDLGGVASVLSPAYAVIRALQRGGEDKEHDVAEAAKMAASMRKHGGKAPKARSGRKSGGAAPNLTVIVADKSGARPMQADQGRPAAVPMPMPTTPPPMQSQMPVVPPPPAPMPSQQKPPIALKTGGRVSKAASSYKDMEAGAGTGEGRLQKTDIAGKRKNAPARFAGGRVA